MVISHTLRYVYIGIPRTGSKSMSEWLTTRCEGEYVGYHHQWLVPEEARDYLIFTVVRNPYDRWTSAAFGRAWAGEKPREELREYVGPPTKPTESLEEQIREVTLEKDATQRGGGNVPENCMNQWFYSQRAGVSLVLFFERSPECLKELPFVTSDDLPDFPHVLERGIRPPGDFFDHFDDEQEKVVWAYASEDYEAFGYRRFDASLPIESPNSLIIG